MMRKLAVGVIAPVITCCALLYSTGAKADGVVVDRIYNPYVQPLETEIEWRTVVQSDDELVEEQRYSLGVGRALTDRLALEFYTIGTKRGGAGLSVDTYELEAKWQLTEQGEYSVDWGLVFELEREVSDNIWEASSTLLASRDFGRWTGMANLGVAFEWGSGIENEVETELRLQARYRFKEAFEPAVELHVGQDTRVLGPALTGLWRLAPGKKLRWELGAFLGIDEKSPDRTLKLNLEYEF